MIDFEITYLAIAYSNKERYNQTSKLDTLSIYSIVIGALIALVIKGLLHNDHWILNDNTFMTIHFSTFLSLLAINLFRLNMWRRVIEIKDKKYSRLKRYFIGTIELSAPAFACAVYI